MSNNNHFDFDRDSKSFLKWFLPLAIVAILCSLAWSAKADEITYPHVAAYQAAAQVVEAKAELETARAALSKAHDAVKAAENLRAELAAGRAITESLEGELELFDTAIETVDAEIIVATETFEAAKAARLEAMGASNMAVKGHEKAMLTFLLPFKKRFMGYDDRIDGLKAEIAERDETIAELQSAQTAMKVMMCSRFDNKAWDELCGRSAFAEDSCTGNTCN